MGLSSQKADVGSVRPAVTRVVDPSQFNQFKNLRKPTASKASSMVLCERDIMEGSDRGLRSQKRIVAGKSMKMCFARKKKLTYLVNALRKERCVLGDTVINMAIGYHSEPEKKSLLKDALGRAGGLQVDIPISSSLALLPSRSVTLETGNYFLVLEMVNQSFQEINLSAL